MDLVTAMPIIVQSPTPTDDDDDVPSTPLRPIRRRKSRLERWIEDQHAPPDARQGDEITRRSSRKSYPYLAYPDMRRARSASRDQDSESMAEGFVLVDGDDETGGPSRDPEDVFEAPAVLSTPQSTRNYTSLLRTPPSLRAFHVSLSPSRRASSSTYDPSPSLSHHSIFQRHSHSMGRHGRTASDGSVALPQLQQDEHDSPSPALSAKPHGPWTFRRPSVLGTFAPPDASADEGSAFHLSPPRRSFSSTLTFSSGTTGVSTDPCTPNHGSPSSVSSTPSKGPNHSLWSLPPGASHLQDPPNSEASVLVKPGSLRLPFSLKASSKPFRHVPTVLPISRDRRKKKLIVSGIAKGDQPRLEGVRKWCEVRQPRTLGMGTMLTTS
ncbi:hypothetical protein BC834DRAFT_27829 [Gloeopeniophorella convolvens]|nr:hypothetical protein BC834DRAFT_27829 [Gloeopeniophorella convolvens]